MTTRVVHYRLEPFDISIKRPTIWGNPFVGKDAIERYERWVKNSNDAQARIVRGNLHLLRGKVLGCACKHRPDIPCHGDVLARMADAT